LKSKKNSKEFIKIPSNPCSNQSGSEQGVGLDGDNPLARVPKTGGKERIDSGGIRVKPFILKGVHNRDEVGGKSRIG